MASQYLIFELYADIGSVFIRKQTPDSISKPPMNEEKQHHHDVLQTNKLGRKFI